MFVNRSWRVAWLAFLLVAVQAASAQSSDWDLSSAEGVVNSLLAVGAVITVSLALFTLARRAADAVAGNGLYGPDDDY